MRRYEKGQQFWEIAYGRDAFTIEITEGKLGKPGTLERLKYRAFDKARAEYRKRLDAKLRAKWQPAQPVEPTEAALEAAILAQPDELDNYLVYGDWLQAQGHPRGELVAAHAALAKLPLGKPIKPTNDYHPPLASWPWHKPPSVAGAKKLRDAEQRILTAHAFELAGTLQDDLEDLNDEDRIRVEWCLGFIRALRFDLGGAGIDRLAPVTTLLAHPSARFLRGLALGELYDDGFGDKAVAAIAARLPRTLHSLFLGDFEIGSPEISWVNIGNVSPIYQTAPHLETLLIQGADIRLGKAVELPRLRHLEIRTGGLSAETVGALSASRLPELETLVVWLGDPDYGATSSIADLAGILAGKGLPKLRHLGLMNAEYTNDIAAALGRAKIVKQLQVLDLSMGSLDDDGARSLASARSALGHLEKLDVTDCYLTPAGAQLVKGLTKKVLHAAQREPYDWDDEKRRYASIGE